MTQDAVVSIERFAQSLRQQIQGPNFASLTCRAMRNYAPRLTAVATELAARGAPKAHDLKSQAALWGAGCEALPEQELRDRLQRLIATSRSVLGGL